MSKACILVGGALLAACSVAMAGQAAPPVATRAAEACGPVGGGLRLPGSAICLHLGGLARAEAATTSAARPGIVGGGTPAAPARGSRFRAQTLRAQGRVDLDARAETAAGPVRAFLSLRTP